MSKEKSKKTRNLKLVKGSKTRKAEHGTKSKNRPLDKKKIKPGLMVNAKGSGETGGVPGKHVGTVNHLDGGKYIKLSKDNFANPRDRWIPLDWVEKADGKGIYLNKTEDEFNSGVYHKLPREIHKKAV